jgi:hypothetical protein
MRLLLLHRKDGRVSEANHRAEVEALLHEWAENPKQHKNILNCLVQFLADDPHWTMANLSFVDKAVLKALASEF